MWYFRKITIMQAFRLKGFYCTHRVMLFSFGWSRCFLRSMHGTTVRHQQVSQQHEGAMDYFRRKASVYLSRKKNSICCSSPGQLVQMDPVRLLELCWDHNSPTVSQNILAILMEAYFIDKNHIDAFKLFHNTYFRAAFEGKQGLNICLLLMLLMYENKRHMNVITLYQYILMDPSKDKDVLKLADALFVSSLLKSNVTIMYQPPLNFTLSRIFLALHHTKNNNFQLAEEALSERKKSKYKGLRLNLLVQIHAANCRVSEVFTLLQEAAFFGLHLFSDTWNLVHRMGAKGARNHQLSRYFLWATSRGLKKDITLEQSLELLVKHEIENAYEVKKYNWDNIGKWIEDTGTRRSKSKNLIRRKSYPHATCETNEEKF